MNKIRDELPTSRTSIRNDITIVETNYRSGVCEIGFYTPPFLGKNNIYRGMVTYSPLNGKWHQPDMDRRFSNKYEAIDAAIELFQKKHDDATRKLKMRSQQQTSHSPDIAATKAR